MKFGHCKNCWWNYNHCCYMSGAKVNDDSYCPDFYSRRKGNKESGTIKEWINQHPEINIKDFK